LRAEAGRDVAWVVDHSNQLDFEAHARDLARALDELAGSVSWRITAPLRRLRAGARSR
jgi:hypothetical protein